MVGWAAGLLLCVLYVAGELGDGREYDDPIVDTFSLGKPNDILYVMKCGITGKI